MLWGRSVNVGYTIIHRMLSIPEVTNHSFPYDNFIAMILRHFRVPIDEPTFEPTKHLRDEAICSLGYDCMNKQWVKTFKNKYTLITLDNQHTLNDVIPPS